MIVNIKIRIDTKRSVAADIKDEIKALLIAEINEFEQEMGYLRAAIEEELDDIEVRSVTIGAE